MKILAYAVSLALMGATPPSDQTRDLEHRSPTTSGQRIEIRGLSGSEIEFKSWDRNEVAMTIHVRISSSDEEYEEEYVRSLNIRETKSEATLLLEFVELRRGVRGGGFWSLFSGGNYVRKEIRGEVFVPRSNALTTDFSYGSMALENMKGELRILGKNNSLSLKECSDVRAIENDYGESTLQNCGGDLKLQGTSSKVTIESFAGPVDVDARYSTITVRGVTQTASIKSQSGRITAESIGGNVTIQSDYTTIVASAIKGDLTVGTKSGNLRVKGVRGLMIEAPYTTVEASDVASPSGKPVTFSGQSGSLTLENVKGDLILDGPYSNMDLKNIQGSVDLLSKSSRITAEEISGDWKSKTEYSTMRLRSLRSNIVRITNKSNDVRLELRTVPGEIAIRNEYGGVEVTMPKGFGGEVTLDAEYGSIDTDFPIRSKKTGSSAYAVGTVGSGKGRITIETKSAGISLTQR
ncbi:MAG: DUF4097 family beta strand repeat-containing protein [Bacteroidota bacterium]